MHMLTVTILDLFVSFLQFRTDFVDKPIDELLTSVDKLCENNSYCVCVLLPPKMLFYIFLDTVF